MLLYVIEEISTWAEYSASAELNRLIVVNTIRSFIEAVDRKDSVATFSLSPRVLHDER